MVWPDVADIEWFTTECRFFDCLVVIIVIKMVADPPRHIPEDVMAAAERHACELVALGGSPRLPPVSAYPSLIYLGLPLDVLNEAPHPIPPSAPVRKVLDSPESSARVGSPPSYWINWCYAGIRSYGHSFAIEAFEPMGLTNKASVEFMYDRIFLIPFVQGVQGIHGVRSATVEKNTTSRLPEGAEGAKRPDIQVVIVTENGEVIRIPFEYKRPGTLRMAGFARIPAGGEFDMDSSASKIIDPVEGYCQDVQSNLTVLFDGIDAVIVEYLVRINGQIDYDKPFLTYVGEDHGRAAVLPSIHGAAFKQLCSSSSFQVVQDTRNPPHPLEIADLIGVPDLHPDQKISFKPHPAITQELRNTR